MTRIAVINRTSENEGEDDEGFPIISNNANAPCNQAFKLKKPAMQGNAATLKVQDQFKTQIYTLVCLLVTVGMFLLAIYVILPRENVDVPDEIDPLKQIQKAGRTIDKG